MEENRVVENVCISENIREDDSSLSNANEVVDDQSQMTDGNTVLILDKIRKDSSTKENNVDAVNEDPTNDENNVDEDDDDDAVIIEPEAEKTIDLDEASTEELLAFDEASIELQGDASNQSPNTTTTDRTTKATEFVIVDTANVAYIDSADETESIDRTALDIQIKDELAEPNITGSVSANDVLENDPMDLLEPNDRSEHSESTKSNEEPDEEADDMSSSSSIKTGSSGATNVMDWGKDYPWLLYDEEDDVNGYCLYCDAKLNVKSHYYIKQHGLSLYHKERCDNYLAFREEEEKNGLCTPLVEIKQEFGTDSRVAALKLKRKTQSEALNNFNWRRWLEDYTWLERDSSEGNIGRCKYCRVRLNVEFSYLRERHQEGVRHKEAERQHKEGSSDHHHDNTKNDGVIAEEEERSEEIPNVDLESKINWCEDVKNDPLLSRCKACDTVMNKQSFNKHLRSLIHKTNVNTFLLKRKKISKQTKRSSSSVSGGEEVDALIKKKTSWELYKKQHPWMVPDPNDSNFAYCKYCEKRMVYGFSVVKRALHENSSQHKINEKSFKEGARKGASKSNKEANSDQNDDTGKNEKNNNDDDDENEDEEQEDDQDEEDEDDEEEDEETEEEVEEEENDKEEEEEDTNEDENEEEKDDENEDAEEGSENQEEDDKKDYRLKWIPSEKWFSKYPWCKKHKDKKVIFCIYCKITISKGYSREKHQSTASHIAAAEEYLSKQDKKQQKLNQANESYEWVVPLKGNPKMYSCKYCRVRISNFFSKKSHASSKIHQINENLYIESRRKNSKPGENTTINSSQTSTTVTQASVKSSSNKNVQRYKKVIKAPSVVTLVKQMQKRFVWLTYKRSEMRNHYGFCKICNASLYIRSVKNVLRHTRSPRHLSLSKPQKQQQQQQQQQQQKVETDQKPNTRISAKFLKEELQTSSSPIAAPAMAETTTRKHLEGPTTTSATKESPKELNNESTIEELQKRFSWIEKSDRPQHASCRYCNVNIPCKVMFLRNHGISVKHRQCVINFSKANKKISANRKETENSENANEDDNNNNNNDADEDNEQGEEGDDVMVVEDNNEEILISEQDENWDIKSEAMDEHEELDYLLQRSFNKIQKKSDQRNHVRKSLNNEEPPSKRIKRSQSFRRLNESNASLVASLLSTPLTLASCLGPLIQQQIQQAANTSNASAAAAASPAPPPLPVEAENTYDLFFKSVSETMKKLPTDLAAEGKVKVMQIICDLELQALKRQQMSPVCGGESVLNNSSILNNYTPTSTVVTAAQTEMVHDITGGSNEEEVEEVPETIITSYYTNVLPHNTTVTTQGVHHQHVHATTPQTTRTTATSSSPCTNVNIERTNTTNTTPTAKATAIGVMDKNGLQTLQLKSTLPPPTKQIPKSSSASTTAATNVSNPAPIRCIPFKNLSQTMSAGSSEGNTKFTRIHVPLSTAQSPGSNVVTTPTNTTKNNVINFRNIQITKRNVPPQTISSSASSSVSVTTISPSPSHNQQLQQHNQQQQNQQQQHQQQKSIMVNKSPQRTYIANIQPQLQRWGCTVNGTASPNTPISSPATAASINKKFSSKPTSTPITKKFN